MFERQHVLFQEAPPTQEMHPVDSQLGCMAATSVKKMLKQKAFFNKFLTVKNFGF